MRPRATPVFRAACRRISARRQPCGRRFYCAFLVKGGMARPTSAGPSRQFLQVILIWSAGGTNSETGPALENAGPASNIEKPVTA
jgi:hypothetical protein